MRLTVAASIVILAFFSLSDLVDSTFRGWLAGALAVVFAAAMIVGFLTPVIGSLTFVGGTAFLLLSPPQVNSFVLIYLIILSLLTMLFGPGAYSVDARLFGRREIILEKRSGD